MTNLERRIDDAQNKIDLIDSLEDALVSKDGNEYSKIFLEKVDDFQRRTDELKAPSKVKDALSKKVADFLESFDQERIGNFARELDTKLNIFLDGLNKFSVGGTSYKIKEDDWLSQVAQRCFDKHGKTLTWEALYAFNKDNLRGNKDHPESEQANWIYPGEEIKIPEEYRYFSEKELPNLAFDPPPPEHKPALPPEPEPKPEPRPAETVPSGRDAGGYEKPSVTSAEEIEDEVALEAQIAQVKGIIEDKIAELKQYDDDAVKVVLQAYESLVKTASDTVEKGASSELLQNLVNFDESLSEILIEVASYGEGAAEALPGHGEIEKTIVRLIRKVPFLANFTPIGIWTGILHSTLGLENASAREKAIEGAKFVASIIPVAGNLVDIAEGIYGLITGKRMGTDIPQTTGEALFSIGIGIGGLAIDVLTMGLAGAPIKAAFKAGWKIGLRKLPEIIVKAAKEYMVTHAAQALKKPFGAVKDFGKWAAETFVVAPIKFVTTPAKFLWKNKKKIAHEAIETVKHPIQQAKKAAAVVGGGLGSMWGSAKAWWKRRKEDKGKSVEERAAEAKAQNEAELTAMETKHQEVDEAIAAKEAETAAASSKDEAHAAKQELQALRAEREALENRMKGRQMAIEEMAKIARKAEEAKKRAEEAAEKQAEQAVRKAEEAREAKMKQWDAAEQQRGKVIDSLRSADITAMDAKALKKGLATADQEIAALEDVLKHADDMPDDKFSWHERQLGELRAERDRYHKEFESKKETAKNTFTDALAGITAALREIEGKIKLPRLKTPDFSGLSDRLAAAAERLSQLRGRLGELTDFGLRERFEGVIRSMTGKLDAMTKKIKERAAAREAARTRAPEQKPSLVEAPGNAPREKRAEVEPALRRKKKFEQLAQDEKQPHLTRSLLADERFHPKGEVTIEGRTFYIGPIVRGPSNYRQVFIFTEVNGVMVPRIYYKSNSDGGWRATPGKEGSGRYSKGKYEKSNYTTETKPHPEIIDYLEKNEQFPLRLKYDPTQDYFPLHGQEKEVSTYMDEMSRFDDHGLLEGPQKYRPGDLYSVDIDDWIRQSNRLPRGFTPNFSAGPIETRQVTHTLLTPATGQTITIETYPAQLDGRLIHWNMAYDATGRVWIENIYFPDAPVNSYGIRSEIINMGSLTNKPLDYKEQVAGVPSGLSRKFDDDYNDITPLLDQLLPIQEFRAARGIGRQPLRQAA